MLSQIGKLINEDSNFVKENCEILEFLREQEIQLLEQFYTDREKLNKEQSLNLINILHKYDFKQSQDFTIISIVKFKLVSFEPYYLEDIDLIKFFRKNISIIEGENNFIFDEDFPKMKLCAERGLFVALKWFHELDKNEILKDVNILTLAGIQENIEMFLWIREIYMQNFSRLILEDNTINLNILCSRSVVNLCKNGKLEIIKNLIPYFEPKYYDYGDFFQVACVYENIEIAQYISTIIEPNRFILQNALHKILSERSKNALKWILENYDFPFDTNSIFSCACISGSLECVKIVYYTSIDKNLKIFSDIINKHFYKALKIGNNDIAKWIYSLGIVLYEVVIEGFMICCNVGNLEGVKFTHSLELSLYNIRTGFINSCFYSDSLETIKWLYENNDIDQESLEIAFNSIVSRELLDIIEFFLDSCNITKATCERIFNSFQKYKTHKQINQSYNRGILGKDLYKFLKNRRYNILQMAVTRGLIDKNYLA